jgi:hypothetical protein
MIIRILLIVVQGANNMNRILTMSIIFLLVFQTGLFVQANLSVDTNTISLTKTILFSAPIISSEGNYTKISSSEASTNTTDTNQPHLPVYIEVFTFPLGTSISSVSCCSEERYWMSVPFDILVVNQPMMKDEDQCEQMLRQPLSTTIIENEKQYPSNSYEYHLGAGLQDEDHVLFVVVRYYPIIYHQSNRTISWTSAVQIQIEYSSQSHQTLSSTTADVDLIIIAPDSFKQTISPLVFHKNGIGTNTVFQSVEDIYRSYQGRDDAEKIKYYLREMLKEHHISFVLLIGDIHKVPIRTSNVSIFEQWEHAVLSDLYYADIYDSTGGFSSWDTDNDDVFGETGEDSLDLYPDIHVGRFPCSSIEEVSIVVDKVITYEQNTFGQEWFYQMIFIGGNTFPNIFQPGNEGEKHNRMVMDLMQDFTPSSVIWTSEGNFHPWTINRAINKGAGFIDYSGHGFEHGMGTYKPHGRLLKTYLTPYVSGLNNGYELPIIFFDACLTAKLDFVLQDILNYKQYRLFDIIARLLRVDTSIELPCFAYSFLKHSNGGAIATIGATRTAFGDEDFGCEKLSLDFFSSYRRGTRLGTMLSNAQTLYRHQVPTDEFTIEEFVLLGDPSLHVGGYSDDTVPPVITLVNPHPGRIHIKGIPLTRNKEITILGGFQWRPIQVEVSDDVDEAKDIAVLVTIDDRLDRRLEFNRFKQIHELTWNGFGAGRFTMNITAIDRSGNTASIDIPIRYICLHLGR